MQEKEKLNILRHSRHDWMNIVQVIKGNLQLDRKDRVYDILNEVTRRAEHEAKLSDLNTPDLAYTLITFNWQWQKFHLDIEMIGKPIDCARHEKCWLKFFSHFFEKLNEQSDSTTDPTLLVSFHLQEKPYIEFDFQGGIEDMQNMQNWLAEWQVSSSCYVENIVANEQELVFVLNKK